MDCFTARVYTILQRQRGRSCATATRERPRYCTKKAALLHEGVDKVAVGQIAVRALDYFSAVLISDDSASYAAGAKVR